MTRTLKIHALTALFAASLQIPMTAAADDHTLVDRVKPAGILVIKESAAVTEEPAAAQQESATTPAAIPGGQPAAETAAPAAEPAMASAADNGEGKAVYDTKCFACHGAGVAGAPKFGDRTAWAPRIEKGMDALMTTVMNGKGAMPPKGTCMECSDEQLEAAARYMVDAAR